MSDALHGPSSHSIQQGALPGAMPTGGQTSAQVKQAAMEGALAGVAAEVKGEGDRSGVADSKESAPAAPTHLSGEGSTIKRLQSLATSLVGRALKNTSSKQGSVERAPLGQVAETCAGPVADHPVMKSFMKDPGPKILLVAEGHGSGSTMAARQFIAGRGDVHGFSEGKTGSPHLGGLPGLEEDADFEIAPHLRRFKASDEAGIRDVQGLKEDLEFYKVSKKDIKRIEKEFIPGSAETRSQMITYFQNERRDKRLAKSIKDQCKTLRNDPERSVGVGFFGATHISGAFDTEGDVRTNDERLPQLLEKMGKRGENSVKVGGVNVYFYPQAMTSDDPDPSFGEFFPRGS